MRTLAVVIAALALAGTASAMTPKQKADNAAVHAQSVRMGNEYDIYNARGMPKAKIIATLDLESIAWVQDHPGNEYAVTLPVGMVTFGSRVAGAYPAAGIGPVVDDLRAWLVRTHVDKSLIPPAIPACAVKWTPDEENGRCVPPLKTGCFLGGVKLRLLTGANCAKAGSILSGYLSSGFVPAPWSCNGDSSSGECSYVGNEYANNGQSGDFQWS